jgi:hypothetical protein
MEAVVGTVAGTVHDAHGRGNGSTGTAASLQSDRCSQPIADAIPKLGQQSGLTIVIEWR